MSGDHVIDAPFKPIEYEVLDEAGEVVGTGLTAQCIFDELVAQGEPIRRKAITPQVSPE